MAQSILDKVRNLTLGNIHQVLDAAIDRNSIASIKQRLRDLESARDMMSEQRAVASARVNSLPLEVARLQAQCDEANRNIDLILDDGDDSNDHLADDFQKKIIILEQQIAVKQEQINTNQAEAKQYADVVARCNSELTELSGRLQVLEELQSSADAKERTAKALKSINLGDGPSVDNAEQRLRDRAVAAGARLGNQLDRLNATGTGVGSMLDATVAARMAERKQRLAAAKAAETATPATGTQG